MALKLAPQCEIGPLRTGKHHHAAGVTVETVHHTGTLFASHLCHVRKILQEDVAERSVRISGRTVHNDARRLVDDNHVAVGMDYLHGDIAAGLHLLLW